MTKSVLEIAKEQGARVRHNVDTKIFVPFELIFTEAQLQATINAVNTQNGEAVAIKCEALAREHELYCLSGKPKLFQDGFNKGFHEGWQAAKADSEKEIAELQAHDNKLIERIDKAIHAFGGQRVWEFSDVVRSFIKE